MINELSDFLLCPSPVAPPQGSEGSPRGAGMLLLPESQPSGFRWGPILAQYPARITLSLPKAVQKIAIRLNVSDTPEGAAKKKRRMSTVRRSACGLAWSGLGQKYGNQVREVWRGKGPGARFSALIGSEFKAFLSLPQWSCLIYEMGVKSL